MDLMFPYVKYLVKVGGQCKGYLPIFQGKNTGPHEDANHKKEINDYFERKGWKWVL